MATRQERMRDRMRGAAIHNVGDIDFGFIIPAAEHLPDAPEPSSANEASPTPTRPSPNSSAKRKRLHRDASRSPLSSQSTAVAPAPVAAPPARAASDIYSIPDHTTEGGATTTAAAAPSSPLSHKTSHPPTTTDVDADHLMADAPTLPQQQQPRGPLSSVIAATKHLSFDASSPPSRRHPHPDEMEVTESPADAPGSGRRRPLRLGAGTPVVGSSTLLQKVLEDLDEGGNEGMAGGSSPIERRVAARMRREEGVRTGAGRGIKMGAVKMGAGSVGGKRRSPGLFVGGSSSVAGSEVGGEEVEVEESVLPVEVEESVLPVEDEEEQEEKQEEEQEAEAEEAEEAEEAQEVDEQEAAQRLGRKRPRRSLRSPSPELGSSIPEASPAPKRRRRREAAASPAQQQQPARRTRANPPAKQTQPKPAPPPPPQPQRQPESKPKPQPKKRTRKSKPPATDTENDDPTTSVPVTVQRFTKPRRSRAAAENEAADEGNEENSPAAEDAIPFARRSGVNAIDVLSKLCEELGEVYTDKLEARARAAEDAAARREQKTMHRALQAFQEELRTRLLEHTIALDNLHALRKRVRATQKEKLALRDDILRIRAEREQVALRMDAVRIRHEADSKEALRHISLSSAMHDIDLAVERGQAAPELSPAEQKKAELANLELLVSRVADQASSRSHGGGTLKQIREFNAFLERTAAILEGR